MNSPLLFLLGLSIFCFSCQKKPEIAECRRACWNHNVVKYWAKVDADVAGLSPEAATKLRAQREVSFREIEEREEDQGLMNCITGCQNDRSHQWVQCMIAAKTSAAVDICEES